MNNEIINVWLLLICGVVVIFALSLYFLILKASAELMLQRQINKDILFVELNTDIDFKSNNIGVEKSEVVNLDKVELIPTSNWKNLVLGRDRYFGSQISFLIENWLFNVALKKGIKCNLQVDPTFSKKKFRFIDCVTILKFIKCIYQSKIESVDLLLKYNAGKVEIMCMYLNEVDFLKALNALGDLLEINSSKSLKLISEEKNKMTLLIDL